MSLERNSQPFSQFVATADNNNPYYFAFPAALSFFRREEVCGGERGHYAVHP